MYFCTSKFRCLTVNYDIITLRWRMFLIPVMQKLFISQIATFKTFNLIFSSVYLVCFIFFLWVIVVDLFFCEVTCSFLYDSVNLIWSSFVTFIGLIRWYWKNVFDLEIHDDSVDFYLSIGSYNVRNDFGLRMRNMVRESCCRKFYNSIIFFYVAINYTLRFNSFWKI